MMIDRVRVREHRENIMRLVTAFWMSVVLICAPIMVNAAAAPESFAEIVKPLLPAVVNISTTQKVQQNPAMDLNGMFNDPQMAPFRDLFRQLQPQLQAPHEQKVTSLGSGFVIDSSGYIVTNNHVIADATEVTVKFHDNSTLKAKILGHDPKTDLALLKVTPKAPLTAVKFGNSDAAQVGDWVIAIGNPFGLGGSVSAGIISARGRNINAGAYDDFIQTDAAINRGNSGGPLFNTAGEVIGINSAIFSPTGGNIGIGFSIPSTLAKPVLDQLRSFGRIHRGWLGVKIQEVNEEVADSVGLKEPKGALIMEITPKGPAHGTGIEVGDVIVKFDGKDIDALRSLPRVVAETKIGKRVPVTVWREGVERTYNVTLGELPDDKTLAEEADDQKDSSGKLTGDSTLVLGLKVKPLTRSLARQFGINEALAGLLIVGVKDDSVAADKGVRAGDIVIGINQQPTTSPAQMQAAVKQAKAEGRAFVLVRLARDNQQLFLTLPVE